MFSSVTSWLGVGTRPNDNDDNKENEGNTPSECKDSISSTSITSVSSKSGLNETETESSDSDQRKVPIGTPEDTSPSQGEDSKLDALEDVSAKAFSTAKEFGS